MYRYVYAQIPKSPIVFLMKVTVHLHGQVSWPGWQNLLLKRRDLAYLDKCLHVNPHEETGQVAWMKSQKIRPRVISNHS